MTPRERLFQTPLSDFIATRKTLAAELKAAGHKADAAELLKVSKPTVSVWAVNQLWWKQRPAFEALLTAAKAMRGGDLSKAGDHRAALAALMKAATQHLDELGSAATDATLRRIETTLSAVAATGFEPDAPGMLTEDREATGFSALGISSLPIAAPDAPPSPPPAPVIDLAAEAAARKKREAEAAAAEAARKKAIDVARETLEGLRQRAAALEKDLAVALSEVNAAEEALAELESR